MQRTSNYISNIPHLVTMSGRHEKAVEKIIEELKFQPVDPEVIALFHGMHKRHISKHLARGYVLLGKCKIVLKLTTVFIEKPEN